MKCFPASVIVICSLALTAAPAVRAQASSSSGNFEELASRAEALVDSNPAEAVKLFRQALTLHPSWAEGWFYMAGDLYQLKEYKESRDAFRKGLTLAPQNGTAWGFLGLSEYVLGDYSQSFKDLIKGEQIGFGGNRPFEQAVRAHAAFILIRQSIFDEALTQLQPIAKAGESSPLVITAAGLAMLAMPILPTEIPQDKLDLVELTGKASWADAARKPEESKTAYEELLKRYPDAPGVHYAYGTFLMEIDQHQALAEFQKELAAHPNHWPSLLIAAFLETREGFPEVSLQYAQRAIKLAPPTNRWIAETATGHAYLTMGDPDKAIPMLEAALKAQPENASVHFYLAQAYRQTGRKADAQRENAEFLRIKEQQDPLMLPNGPAMGANAMTRQ